MWNRWLFLGVISGIVTIGMAQATQPASPLAVAKRLAQEKYPNWKYPPPGPSAAAQTIDCVTFLLDVVETTLGQPVDAATKKRILISDLAAADVETAVTGNDPRIKGVQKALIDAGTGTNVELAQAKSGDLIQYWMKNADGKWVGHSGILETVSTTGTTIQSTIYSASASLNGIGTSTQPLRLNAQDGRKVFIVRLNAHPATVPH